MGVDEAALKAPQLPIEDTEIKSLHYGIFESLSVLIDRIESNNNKSFLSK